METNTPSAAEVRSQLDRLQNSPVFASSERLLVLLRHLVEETLRDGGVGLKEAAIGNAVYGREPPYDPRIDSTVRVEAGRLRRKLREYYAGDGRRDPLWIDLPVGGYMVAFTWGNAAEKEATVREGGSIFEQGRGAVVAIMPLRALSPDAEDEIFADGLTDELIYAMGRLPGWRIISGSVTFQYKTRPYSPAQLAEELGIDALLQGTVRREGEILRVTVEVSDPRGFALWSHRFDAPARDRMALQEDITATTVNRVQLDNSSMRAMRIKPGPGALEMAATIFRARQLMDEQTPPALFAARDLFAQVAAATADSARGHSGLADVQCDLYRLGLVDHGAALVAARESLREGQRIDPQSIEVHCAQATVAGWLEWDRRRAEEYFESAFKLGGNARAARLHGVHLTFLARHEEAERQFRRARALEPFSAHQDIAEAISHYQARRHEVLIRTGEEEGALVPAEALFYRSLSRIFGGGREPSAAELDALETDGRPDLAFARVELDAWLGRQEPGRTLLAAGTRQGMHFARATLAAALGETEYCLATLEASLAARELAAVWLRSDARFDRLRSLPRFRELVAALDARQSATERAAG